MYLVGIVSNISKKKDNRGNPMAFIEMEDLSGKFEVPLFNRDYESYLPLMEVGRVFLVYGTRSQFNGNDDGLLRVMPKAMLPFENLARELRGTLKIRLNQSQVKKGLLLELTRRLKQSSGLVKLQVEAQASDDDYYLLEAGNGLYPDNSILQWLDAQKLDFSLDCVVSDVKNA
jgi:DNA polymerase-3 subunit alpha